MSATAIRSEYASLLTSTLPAVIRSAAERRVAELLTLLMEDFEEKHYGLHSTSPIEVWNELMVANNLRQKDLLDVFGSPNIVSEGLSGKRKLNADHIRSLSRRFKLSPEVYF